MHCHRNPQATETNQGLGSGDDADDDDADDGNALADAADAVDQAAEDTVEAIGDFFDETF